MILGAARHGARLEHGMLSAALAVPLASCEHSHPHMVLRWGHRGPGVWLPFLGRTKASSSFSSQSETSIYF